MDEGPFRMPRPADRSASSRPEPSHRPTPPPQPPEEQQPAKEVKEEPKTVHRPAATHRFAHEEEKPWKRFVLPAGIVAAVIILVMAAILLWPKSQSNVAAIESNKYQAVFFTNGQVYFGKLQAVNQDYMKLTDVYYLKTESTSDTTNSKNPQQSSSDQNNAQLIKLGDEIHGPEDAMVISKDQVLFYENLKPDGKVSKSIEQYKSSKK